MKKIKKYTRFEPRTSIDEGLEKIKSHINIR
jgi:hypothetical protein